MRPLSIPFRFPLKVSLGLGGTAGLILGGHTCVSCLWLQEGKGWAAAFSTSRQSGPHVWHLCVFFCSQTETNPQNIPSPSGFHRSTSYKSKLSILRVTSSILTQVV